MYVCIGYRPRIELLVGSKKKNDISPLVGRLPLGSPPRLLNQSICNDYQVQSQVTTLGVSFLTMGFLKF